MPSLKSLPRILITPGEPAGIGPDVTIQLAQHTFNAQLIVIADPDLLMTRAKQLNLPLHLINADLNAPVTKQPQGSLYILPLAVKAPVIAGQLNVANAAYVIETLALASDLCLQKKADAIVTGPVHKGIINQAQIPFSGHTEFFAEKAHVGLTVMMFVISPSLRGALFATKQPRLRRLLLNSLKTLRQSLGCFVANSAPRNDGGMRIALVTTHLPLSAVPAAITKEKLRDTLKILHHELKNKFHIEHPRIAICGLNPHAGENGYLGREEIDIITPVINELNRRGFNLTGPLSADTIFTPKQTEQTDAILAMYHDQALPLVKYASFGHAVNITLGLPFIRTSVDHGTALDVAGTGQADGGSLFAATQLSIELLSPGCAST